MIKVEEIRIGNIFEYKGYCMEFSIEDYNEIYHNNQFLELFLKPMLLTEEWLMKLGFIKTLGSYNKSFGNYDYQIEKHENYKDGYIFFIVVPDVAAPPSVKIKYVHQLQNLYFTLTGTELKIK